MIYDYDFIVIGAGIAGASIAAHLAEHASVLLLEMEDQPGYHSTGRSAALFLRTYGNSVVRGLTRASHPFFYDPPAAFTSTPLVTPRSILITARPGQEASFEAFTHSIDPEDHFDLVTADQAREAFPLLKTDDLVAAALTHGPSDIEVHELHHGYLRMFKARGGVLATSGGVQGLVRNGDNWTVATKIGGFTGSTIVNAAGAWAGEVGKMASALDIGLRPLKRTAFLVEPPPGAQTAKWPLLYDVEDQFYLKPDAGLLLISPADETLSEPGDVQADELDIAIGVDRVEQATTLQVRRISHRWAGLRSFVADSSPVVGYDPIQPGFFWLAGLGGFGIQTAPALSNIAARLALGQDAGPALADAGVTANAIGPHRLITAPAIA